MKQFLLTWLGAFVTITGLLYALNPFIIGWPVWLKAFALSGLMVLIMQKIVMPMTSKIICFGKVDNNKEKE